LITWARPVILLDNNAIAAKIESEKILFSRDTWQYSPMATPLFVTSMIHETQSVFYSSF